MFDRIEARHATQRWYSLFQGYIMDMTEDDAVESLYIRDGIVTIKLVGGYKVDFTYPRLSPDSADA